MFTLPSTHSARPVCQGRCRPSATTRSVVTTQAIQQTKAHGSAIDASLQPSAEPAQPAVHTRLSRRDALALSALVLAAVPSQAQAVGFQKTLKKRKLAPEDYVADDAVGLKIYELEEGKGGEPIKVGDHVLVHYDCIYRGIDVVSSRSARLLGGNRTIAEPYEYVVGDPVLGIPLKKISDGANGLFAGQGGPKPPPALSKAVLGMKKGGKRSILVDDPALGYPKGQLEIPEGAAFELKVEVLDITKVA